MIYELISFNHHNNGVALYRCYGGNNSSYKKKSFSASGNRIILNEYAGYTWYYSQLNEMNEVRILSESKYYELLMPHYSGQRIYSTSTLVGNEEYIELILELYIKIWNQQTTLKVHGDFALGNFIFSNEIIYLIDWEHYHEANEEIWGYDIFHLLFVALQRQSFSMNRSTKSFLRSFYKKISDSAKESNIIMSKPFQNSSSYLRENSSKFGKKGFIENKFALATVDDAILQNLDKMIT